MKQILVIHTGEGGETTNHSFMGHNLSLRRAGCGGDPERARALIQEYDGKVDAIGLEGMPATLELGAARPKDVSPVAENTLHARDFIDLARQLALDAAPADDDLV